MAIVEAITIETTHADVLYSLLYDIANYLHTDEGFNRFHAWIIATYPDLQKLDPELMVLTMKSNLHQFYEVTRTERVKTATSSPYLN